MNNRVSFFAIAAIALLMVSFHSCGNEEETIPDPDPVSAPDGTADNPFIIKTPADLNNVRNNLFAHYKLGNDIDLNIAPYNTGMGWEPIAASPSAFFGSFDGAGYKITAK